MDYARIVEHLELALIELEYATADFAYRKAANANVLELIDLEGVRIKMNAANRAMELAIQLLETKQAAAMECSAA
jgi:hypothetical protein